MIKAVVVDDERLVRKGFISLIDWASFGVVITGEAGDGKAALELLRSQETDLLFVDLTMPGMSGFDLIRQVRQRYPSIRSVVLTCHHEFDYVQEALRLGAVDYIVKTLLEVENADQTIRRLVERIEWENNNRLPVIPGEKRMLTADKGLLYLPLEPEAGEEELFQLSLVKNHPLLSFQEMWMTPLNQRFAEEEARREFKHVLGNRWRIALVSGLRDQGLQEVEAILGRTVHHALFYSGGTEEPSRLHYADLRAMAAKTEDAGAAAGACLTEEFVLQKALSLRWTLDRGEWETFTAAVQIQQPSAQQVAAFGQVLLQSWGGLLLKPEEKLVLEGAAEHCLNWEQWKRWLRQFSDDTQRRLIELNLSKEVMLCLIRAVRYMQTHAGDKINQSDVAAAVNMSRGYFSQCFARFAGESFGESLRRMRLNLAKALLLETNDPISEIASKSGFEDDRYFSRLFRDRVGKLPSEYRAEGEKRE